MNRDPRYRYLLERAWDAEKPRVCFVMLNPSTADEVQDDPTVRKCRGFAERLGFGCLSVVNLFAWRSTKPTGLLCAADPVGPHNDAVVEDYTWRAGLVIAAWGAHGELHRARVDQVVEIIRRHRPAPLHCLGTTLNGHPRHPLMTPYATALAPWSPARVAA